MPRNLDRRVEILFPVLDRKLLRRLRDGVIEKYLADTRKCRIGKPDGTYTSVAENGAGAFDSQAWFVKNRKRLSD